MVVPSHNKYIPLLHSHCLAELFYQILLLTFDLCIKPQKYSKPTLNLQAAVLGNYKLLF